MSGMDLGLSGCMKSVYSLAKLDTCLCYLNFNVNVLSYVVTLKTLFMYLLYFLRLQITLQ
jgi:hypothetical protein